MPPKLPARETPGELLDRLLDGGYDKIAKRTITAITKTGPELSKRLDELDAEARRLAAEGERLSPDNPVVLAVKAELDKEMQRAANLMGDVAGDLADGGIDAANEVTPQLPLTMVDAADFERAASIMVNWNRVSRDAIGSLFDFVDNPAWDEALAKFKLYTPQVFSNIAIRGFLEGWNPLRAAREARRAINDLPASQANSLMRTLYLQSYRRSTTESYKLNRNIFEKAYRVATLDNRVCFLCMVLSGTEIPIDQIVESHYQCRCTSVVKIVNIPLRVPSGENYFLSLPERVQQEKMDEANWLAWKDGKIKFDDLVKRIDDPLFGPMIQKESLYKIIGRSEADRYLELGRQLRKSRGD
jgi:hypothetical protein